MWGQEVKLSKVSDQVNPKGQNQIYGPNIHRKETRLFLRKAETVNKVRDEFQLCVVNKIVSFPAFSTIRAPPIWYILQWSSKK